MKKYNEKTKQYEPYSVPDSWHCPLTANFKEAINCASCGQILEFGDGYTSMQIHNDYGFGYTVCEHCHEKEWKEIRDERAKREANEQ